MEIRVYQSSLWKHLICYSIIWHLKACLGLITQIRSGAIVAHFDISFQSPYSSRNVLNKTTPCKSCFAPLPIRKLQFLKTRTPLKAKVPGFRTLNPLENAKPDTLNSIFFTLSPKPKSILLQKSSFGLSMYAGSGSTDNIGDDAQDADRAGYRVGCRFRVV